MSTKDERGKKIRWLEGVLVAILLAVVADIHHTSKAIHDKLDNVLVTVAELGLKQEYIKKDIELLKADNINIKGDILDIYKALKK